MKKESKWFSIWVKPRATIRKIINTDPKRTIIPLAIFLGIITALTWLVADWYMLPEQRSEFSPLFLIIGLVGGIVTSLVTLYLGSLLLMWTGRWFKGKGSYTNVKCAFGWNNYPLIVGAIFGLLAALAMGHPQPAVNVVLSTISAIIYVWSFILLVKMIAEAHLFSSWRSLIAVIIALAIVIVISIIIGTFVSFTNPFLRAFIQ